MKKTYERPRVEMENFTTDECTASCYAIVDVTEDQRYVARSGIWGKESKEDIDTSGESKYYWNKQDLSDEEQESYTWWNRSHNGILCGRPNADDNVRY